MSLGITIGWHNLQLRLMGLADRAWISSHVSVRVRIALRNRLLFCDEGMSDIFVSPTLCGRLTTRTRAERRAFAGGAFCGICLLGRLGCLTG